MKSWKITSFKEFLDNVLFIQEDSLTEQLDDKAKLEFYGIAHKIKKSQGVRSVYYIKRTSLYTLQKRLCSNFLNKIYLPDCVYGFRKGYDYIDYLSVHKSNNKNRYFIRIDIKDFFGSIKKTDVIDCINYYIDTLIEESERQKILLIIIELLTYKDKIVQGAVTSPVISNLVFRQLDLRIEKYCYKLGVKYSRYADDLLFSSDCNIVHRDSFFKAIRKILSSKDFQINNKKTIKYCNELCINGYVVNNTIRLSRKKLHDFLYTLYTIESMTVQEFKDIRGNYYIKNYLAGYRALLIQIIRENSDYEYTKKLKRFIDRIERIFIKHFK